MFLFTFLLHNGKRPNIYISIFHQNARLFTGTIEFVISTYIQFTARYLEIKLLLQIRPQAS